MPKNSLKNEENEPDDWRDGGRDEDDVLVRNVDRRKQETVERGRHLEEGGVLSQKFSVGGSRLKYCMVGTNFSGLAGINVGEKVASTGLESTTLLTELVHRYIYIVFTEWG